MRDLSEALIFSELREPFVFRIGFDNVFHRHCRLAVQIFYSTTNGWMVPCNQRISLLGAGTPDLLLRKHWVFPSGQCYRMSHFSFACLIYKFKVAPSCWNQMSSMPSWIFWDKNWFGMARYNALHWPWQQTTKLKKFNWGIG